MDAEVPPLPVTVFPAFNPIWVKFCSQNVSVGDETSSLICVKGTSDKPVEVVYTNNESNLSVSPSTFNLSAEKVVQLRITWTRDSELPLQKVLLLKSTSSPIPDYYFINCLGYAPAPVKKKLQETEEELDDEELQAIKELVNAMSEV